MKHDDIVDVEVLSETTAEVKKPSEPKKVTSDHSKAITFWGRLSRLLLWFGSSFCFVFGFAGLAFSILFSQSGFLVYFIMMIGFWSLMGISLLALIFGFMFRRFVISLMKKDPNYEAYVS